MKGLLSKGIAFNVDVIGPENILSAGVSMHFLPGHFTGLDSEGVKYENWHKRINRVAIKSCCCFLSQERQVS